MFLSLEEYKTSKQLTALSVIEDRDYFLWQQEVQLFHIHENFKELNIEVVILYETESPSKWAKKLAENYNVSLYRIGHSSESNYKCQIKPLGVHLRVSDKSKPVLENILAIDSDVIFNKRINYKNVLENSTWLLSDCSSYLDYKYLSKHLNDNQITELGQIVGVSLEDIKSIKKAGGAQYLYKNVSNYPNIFEKMANDSVLLHNRLLEFSELGSKVQVHTAEMWAQLWNIHKICEWQISEDMAFAWATTPIKERNNYTFTHFAGAPSEEGSFKKTKHSHNIFKEDLNYVTFKDNCSYHWYELIEKYKKRSVGFNL